jgi:hypothetical protein
VKALSHLLNRDSFPACHNWSMTEPVQIGSTKICVNPRSLAAPKSDEGGSAVKKLFVFLCVLLRQPDPPFPVISVN